MGKEKNIIYENIHKNSEKKKSRNRFVVRSCVMRHDIMEKVVNSRIHQTIQCIYRNTQTHIQSNSKLIHANCNI